MSILGEGRNVMTAPPFLWICTWVATDESASKDRAWSAPLYYARFRCVMPRYYFNIREDENLIADDEGVELPSISKAQEEAARLLAEVAREVLHHNIARPLAIEVTDESGPVLEVAFTFKVSFRRH